jgi:hypothetical protein
MAGPNGETQILEIAPQTDELRPHRATLEVERASLPDPEQARLENLQSEKNGSPQP